MAARFRALGHDEVAACVNGCLCLIFGPDLPGGQRWPGVDDADERRVGVAVEELNHPRPVRGNIHYSSGHVFADLMFGNIRIRRRRLQLLHSQPDAAALALDFKNYRIHRLSLRQLLTWMIDALFIGDIGNVYHPLDAIAQIEMRAGIAAEQIRLYGKRMDAIMANGGGQQLHPLDQATLDGITAGIKAGVARVVGEVRAGQMARADDMPLGYSAAGEVVEVGSAVSGLRVGQLVATGGAGKANHAEFQAVPGLLCVPVPDGVPAKDAAFTTVASIALHGLRLAEVGPGSKVVVIGLGLVGQLGARLAMAAGCDVVGIDLAAHARITAAGSGVDALDELGEATTEQVITWSRGRGADAVLVCAASHSSAPVTRAPALCRDRAAIVIVGDVGLNLDRTPFYERELSVRFARSYGPGRYDPSYEAWGVDYPVGQVRWTEGRNFEAVLDLMAAGRLKVADLVTHCYEIDEAAAAYQLIEKRLIRSFRHLGRAAPERAVVAAPLAANGLFG